MSNFKCINCGETREYDKKCSCSRCGYTMYELPYDRHKLLARECSRFLDTLLTPNILGKDFDYFRTYVDEDDNGTEKTVSKADDDVRFPSYAKIKRYICSARKSERAVENARRALENIREHLSTEYSRKYLTRYDSIHKMINERERVLIEALSDIDIKAEFDELKLPEFSLQYSETPDSELSAHAYELILLLERLLDKIALFIKRNNVYGGFKESSIAEFDVDASLPPTIVLRAMITEVERKLSTEYTVDVFSDGQEQLEEMLNAFFGAIHLLLFTPILHPEFLYVFSDGDIVLGDGFVGKINAVFLDRYYDYKLKVRETIHIDKFTEDELFELYNKYVGMDAFGIFTVNKNSLVKMGESEKKFDSLTGLYGIKESIRKIKAYATLNKDSDELNLHMCFYGNPGTGKTEVARIIAGILYENKILPKNKVVEVDRSGLVGQYVGETPTKTLSKIHEAMGGVLFIDEAYALVPKDGGFDYGNEAVATLIKAMEDYRGKFCVILAGYKNQMTDMIASNPGFKSRIQFELDFPNYSREELGQITSLMLEKRKYSMTDAAMSKILDITDVKRKEPNFANAREIRNILDQVIMCQNLRAGNPKDKEIGIVDVNKYITDAHINLPTNGEGMTQKILTAEEELDALIGLDSVKRMVKKIRAYAKRNKDDENFNVHMCFYGNPGTGKTEVARILSRILYDAGVLPEAKLIETDAHGLIGKYVGETAPKTEAKIADAMGGVLFIDEAYSLIDNASSNGTTTNYGEEAIAVLLKKMEDYRGRFGVILAGYQTEMKNMLSSNPGLESRIQFTLEFPDYTREELGEIAIRFASKKKYVLEDAALERILDVAEYYRGKPNFANARTVRNILDQVIMNQNLRADDNDLDDNTIILEDVEEYISDEKIMQKPSSERRIGFY